jgi:hypothetical protein
VIDWPPESPDLSQISNFWNMMKRLSNQDREPRPQ